MKYYRPHRHRKDVLMLSLLSRGNVDNAISDARDQLDAEGRLYICDVRRCPLPTGPNVRGVRKQNLLRWLDRAGLVAVECFEQKDLTYALVRKMTGEELRLQAEQKRGMAHAYFDDQY
uniref:Methyltransferase n=1 Tax=viral metagenome TaxID=1070528 RepID=A0A6M3KZT7_9ZZZZ